MKVRPLRDGEPEVVLWDTVRDTNYVRLEQARKMGFPYHKKTARIRVVLGHIITKTLLVFKCWIKDMEGDFHMFFAMGVPDVVGDMGCSLNELQLALLFPDRVGVERLRVYNRKVDYLIGIEHASWQLERKLQAIYGGDF